MRGCSPPRAGGGGGGGGHETGPLEWAAVTTTMNHFTFRTSLRAPPPKGIPGEEEK